MIWAENSKKAVDFFMRDKKIVVIGGGTGLSTMLRGLRMHTHNITAVVTVADDGGSSGVLRSDMGMLPPGDVRNCICALSDTDPILSELLSFRFDEGSLKGHSLGNIILAALNEMSDNFEEAVGKLNQIMGVIGKVYPVTNESVNLRAILEDGTVINGESLIGSYRDGKNKGISKLHMVPENPKPVDGVIKAIGEADIIVLGPGSLYTSIIPNLLVEGVTEAIHKSSAKKVYVCNIMTQPGETDGYTVSDHLRAIEKHSYEGIADAVIVNRSPLPQELAERYAAEHAYQVKDDTDKINNKMITVYGDLLLMNNDKIRHNFSRLARTIVLL